MNKRGRDDAAAAADDDDDDDDDTKSLVHPTMLP